MAIKKKKVAKSKTKKKKIKLAKVSVKKTKTKKKVLSKKSLNNKRSKKTKPTRRGAERILLSRLIKLIKKMKRKKDFLHLSSLIL